MKALVGNKDHLISGHGATSLVRCSLYLVHPAGEGGGAAGGDGDVGRGVAREVGTRVQPRQLTAGPRAAQPAQPAAHCAGSTR